MLTASILILSFIIARRYITSGSLSLRIRNVITCRKRTHIPSFRCHILSGCVLYAFSRRRYSPFGVSLLIDVSGMPRGLSAHERARVHAQAHLSRERESKSPCLFIRPRVIMRCPRVWVRTRVEIFRSALPARLINDIFERQDARRACVCEDMSA